MTTAPNLLVVLLDDEPPQELRDAIAARAEPPGRIHVVAPARVTPLDWLATADDDANREAEVRVLEAEWTLADDGEIEGEAGDADPIQALEDALHRFPADEILVVGGSANRELEDTLDKLALPVTRLRRPSPEQRSGPYRLFRTLAGGHSNTTPFILFAGVNAALLLAAIVLSLLVLLVLWSIGNL